jgi:hypothetical protein
MKNYAIASRYRNRMMFPTKSVGCGMIIIGTKRLATKTAATFTSGVARMIHEEFEEYTVSFLSSLAKLR